MPTFTEAERWFDAALMTFEGGPLDGEQHGVGTQTLRLLFNHRRGTYHLYTQSASPLRMVYRGIVDAANYGDDEVWTL